MGGSELRGKSEKIRLVLKTSAHGMSSRRVEGYFLSSYCSIDYSLISKVITELSVMADFRIFFKLFLEQTSKDTDTN